MSKKKLFIIGNGMAACRLLDELAARGAAFQYEITVFGEEQGGAYNRIMLGKVLAGGSPDDIVTKPLEWYDRHNVRLIDRTRVVKLDTLRKQVETADGQLRSYDVAVLATGSQPVVPSLEGMNDENGELKPGIFVYRTIGDCMRMRERARSGDSAIVVGGGLLGLEAAKVLADRGLHVTVVQLKKTLMNAQLDEIGGEMLERQIERTGIFVRTGRTVEAVYAEERVKGVYLDDGTNRPADIVVLACGVRPRTDVAKASGLPVNRGIIVNDTLATEVPSVYALGECAEHQGKTYGIVAPAWEQAAVLADVLTGRNSATTYRGSKLYTRLKVAGVEVATMGISEPERPEDDVLQIVQDRKDTYRKLIVRDRRLVGAILVGDTSAAGALVQCFDRGDLLPEDPLELLCPTSVAADPATRIVCNCNKVTEGQIYEAVAQGAETIEALGVATKACTGCGSCKTEVTQLIARAPKRGALPLVAAS
ncbi:MAG: NAD(P)/FAD-dependent oxidoreductase [Myxococcales bacterium]|nr:MAG: NAD(P)/FAD-dependent oxidoreductase [Myxococcales bacterium]